MEMGTVRSGGVVGAGGEGRRGKKCYIVIVFMTPFLLVPHIPPPPPCSTPDYIEVIHFRKKAQE